MKQQTRQAISAINQKFYSSDGAAEFSRTRDAPWPGWDRMNNALVTFADPVTVLDIGCGNGRFANYLEQNWNRSFLYFGIDSSQALVDISLRCGFDPNRFHFSKVDATLPDFDAWVGNRTFSLITLFGVIHHIPGCEVRKKMIGRLVKYLKKPGVLVISFWQFGVYKRFLRKVIPWEHYNQGAVDAIDIQDLERGDFLIRWGAEGKKVRYCHYADSEEIDWLIDNLPVRLLDDFRSDGNDNRLNRYLLLAPLKHG